MPTVCASLRQGITMDSSGVRSPAVCAFASNISGFDIRRRRPLPITFQPRNKDILKSHPGTDPTTRFAVEQGVRGSPLVNTSFGTGSIRRGGRLTDISGGNRVQLSIRHPGLGGNGGGL